MKVKVGDKGQHFYFKFNTPLWGRLSGHSSKHNLLIRCHAVCLSGLVGVERFPGKHQPGEKFGFIGDCDDISVTVTTTNLPSQPGLCPSPSTTLSFTVKRKNRENTLKTPGDYYFSKFQSLKPKPVNDFSSS